MRKLLLLALVGLGAQLVDGSLGMAYGVTSTTLLLAIGTNPAAASATVHLAEIGTTLVSGVSHWRFGNVDWKVVLKIGIPGAIGAFAGATFLSSLSTETAAPLMSIILLALGVYILRPVHHLRACPRATSASRCASGSWRPLGVVAGFVDSTGGGGWGPVGTPAILASGRLEPRKTIGSIDTSEFLVAVAASIGFVIGIGSEGINFAWVVAAAHRRRHRRADRGLAGPAHPAAGARLAGRRRHHPDQHPHPAAQRLDRRLRRRPLHLLRGHLRGLGGRAGLLDPRVPQQPRGGAAHHRRGRGGRRRGGSPDRPAAAPSALTRSGERGQTLSPAAIPGHVDEDELVVVGPPPGCDPGSAGCCRSPP